MKIVFIQPQFKNIWESLGIGYIISFCKKYYDFEAEFFHGNFDSENAMVNAGINADIVAFSCTAKNKTHKSKCKNCIWWMACNNNKTNT